MDLNNLLENLNDEFGSKFDDIKKNNIKNLDISSLFNMENSLIKEIQCIKEKSQNLDLIYLNYDKMKSNFNKKINTRKSKLINLNNEKEYYDKTTLKKKLGYLIREYNFYIDQTNTGEYMNNIKLQHNRIEYLLKCVNNKKSNIKYEKVKNKYNNILAFIKSENICNQSQEIPKYYDISDKINWYNKKINEMIEKQMIFNNYIFLLENFYKETVNIEIEKVKIN